MCIIYPVNVSKFYWFCSHPPSSPPSDEFPTDFLDTGADIRNRSVMYSYFDVIIVLLLVRKCKTHFYGQGTFLFRLDQLTNSSSTYTIYILYRLYLDGFFFVSYIVAMWSTSSNMLILIVVIHVIIFGRDCTTKSKTNYCNGTLFYPSDGTNFF